MLAGLLRPRGLLSVLLAVLTLEFCARLDGYITYGTPFFGADSIETLFTTDPLGKIGKPFARYRKWQLNSLGYRGPELNAGRIRILCIGASETFGLYEKEGGEYPRQLERELNRRVGRDAYDVVNVGYAGLTLDNELRRLPQIREKVQPKFALIYPSLANYIWSADAIAPGAPPKPVLASALVALPEPRHFEFHWRILENVTALVKETMPMTVQTKLRQIQIDRETRHEKVMERLPENQVDRFRNDLTNLIAGLRAEGVEPVLATHATRFGRTISAEDRPYLIAWRKFYPNLAESGFLDMESRMNNALKKVAAKQRVAFVDTAEAIPPDGRYFADFCHFTDAGAALMARTLADALMPILEKMQHLPRSSDSSTA